MTDTFETERRIRLLSYGYEPIPIHARDKACYVTGWTTDSYGFNDIRAWETQRADHESTGCRTGALAVVDIDLSDPDHASAVTETVQITLGLCPYIRIGHKPGGALCYFNTQPIKKITISGLAPGAKEGNKAEVVEFLGKGQQLVVYGFHYKKGANYEWPERDLSSARLKDLPTVNRQALHKAAETIMETMIALGYTDVKVKGSGMNMDRPHRGKSTENRTPVTAEWLTEMFDLVGEDCMMGEWIGWMCVWKYTPLVDAETGEPDEDFDRFSAFQDWSASGDRGNYQGYFDCLKAWNSKGERDARQGSQDSKNIGSLIFEAQRAGYAGPTYWGAHQPPGTPYAERLRGVTSEETQSGFRDISSSRRRTRRPRVERLSDGVGR